MQKGRLWKTLSHGNEDPNVPGELDRRARRNVERTLARVCEDLAVHVHGTEYQMIADDLGQAYDTYREQFADDAQDTPEDRVRFAGEGEASLGQLLQPEDVCCLALLGQFASGDVAVESRHHPLAVTSNPDHRGHGEQEDVLRSFQVAVETCSNTDACPEQRPDCIPNGDTE